MSNAGRLIRLINTSMVGGLDENLITESGHDFRSTRCPLSHSLSLSLYEKEINCFGESLATAWSMITEFKILDRIQLRTDYSTTEIDPLSGP